MEPSQGGSSSEGNTAEGSLNSSNNSSKDTIPLTGGRDSRNILLLELALCALGAVVMKSKKGKLE